MVYYEDEKLIIRNMETEDARIFTDELTAQGWHPDIAGYMSRLTDQAGGKCIALSAVYPDVQAFKRLYDEATILVEQYNRDLAAWERQVHGEPQPQQAPPEKESIRKKLRDMEAEAKRRNDARQQTRLRSYDYDRGR